MFRQPNLIVLFLALSIAFGQAQQPKTKAAPEKKPTSSPAKAIPGTTPDGGKSSASPTTDYSKEAFVVEQSATVYRFETDGTLKKTTSARYKVQSEAALQRLGQLIFGYSSATERLKVDYVRVHKANGTIVTAPDTAEQD